MGRLYDRESPAAEGPVDPRGTIGRQESTEMTVPLRSLTAGLLPGIFPALLLLAHPLAAGEEGKNVESLLERGEEAFERGEVEEALKIFNEAQKLIIFILKWKMVLK